MKKEGMYVIGRQIKNRWKKSMGAGGCGGFTLVELVVTMALLVILLSASAGGVVAYTRYANLKRNDEHARTIYNAAQAALTHAKASGTLEELQTQVEELGGADGMSGRVPGGDGELTYLMSGKGELASGEAAAVLLELLRPYITDASVFDAAICLEADFQEGLVNGVWYCDRTEGFAYGESTGTVSNGLMGISDKGEAARRPEGIGYYGADSTGSAPSTDTEASISELMLVNDETLSLQWTMKDAVQPSVQQLAYTVRLYEKGSETEGDRLKAEFEFQPGEHASGGITTLEYGGTKLEDVNVTLYEYGVDGTQTSSTAVCDFQAYISGNDYQINLILDAVDLGLTGSSTGESGSLADTYSILRLGLDPFTRCYAQVQASGGGFQTGAWRQSNEEQPLFGLDTVEDEETQEETAGQVCVIENSRHLYNAVLMEVLEGEQGITYHQTASFGWGGSQGILEHGNVYYLGIRVEYSAEENPAVPAFPGFTVLHENSAYLAEEDTVIDYLAFTPEGAVNTALLEEVKTSLANAPGSDTVGRATNDTSAASAVAEDSGLGTTEGTLSANAQSTGSPEETMNGVSAADVRSADPEAETTESGLSANVQGTGFVRTNEGTIDGLILDHVDARGLSASGENGSSSDHVGAVCGINCGTVQNVSVISGSVSGRMYVGGVIGENPCADGPAWETAPTITLEGYYNGADVTGYAYVGGIVGRTGESVVVSNGRNTGTVSGYSADEEDAYFIAKGTGVPSYSSYIGGIVGYAYRSEIRGCSNGGEKQAAPQWSASSWNQGDGQESGRSADAAGNAEGNDGQERASGDTDSRQSTWTAAEAAASLQGSFVGGIVGLNAGSTLDGCTVAADYVTGEYFVGGFTGMSAGLETPYITLACEQDGNGAVNEADIIAKGFAGGITGANVISYTQLAAFAEESMKALPAETEAQETSAADMVTQLLADMRQSVTDCGNTLLDETALNLDYSRGSLKNWTNNGFVAVTQVCAGGITGYNNSEIEDCNSTAGATEESRTEYYEFLDAVRSGTGSAYGSYVGGIAGANNGSICSKTEKGQEVTAATKGNNYVGGITGLNDELGTIRGYTVGEVWLEGTYFVGGMAGLNGNSGLYTSDGVQVAPASVLGDCFVGGVAGANVVRMDSGLMEVRAAVNNAEGLIEAKRAFAGGIWGYDQILSGGENGESLYEAASSLIAAAVSAAESGGLQQLWNEVNDRTSQSASGKILIDGEEQSLRLAAVTAQICAGGVTGYHQAIETEGRTAASVWNSPVLIENMTNEIPVTAEASVQAELVEGEGEVAFSCAGSITGYITQDMFLEACQNGENGMVASPGKYHGSLGEWNEGILQNCVVTDFGTETLSFVGGLVGINGTNGIVYSSVWKNEITNGVQGAECVGGLAAENYGRITLKTQTNNQSEAYRVKVSGSGDVGGVAGRNFGRIEDTVLTGTVTGSGQDIGGVAGENQGIIAGSFIGTTSGTAATGNAAASVNGTGTNVGGIAGRNSGTITTSITWEGTPYDVTEAVSVSGTASVGGIIGLQETSAEAVSLIWLKNAATVTAAAGDAGGIVGGIGGDGALTLQNCRNYGTVTAGGSDSAAAGIVVRNTSEGMVTDCVNQGDVTAASGAAGGIAAVNEGTLSDCRVYVAASGVRVSIQGGNLAGGIVADNLVSAVISGCWVSDVHIQTGRSGAAGGLAGRNAGTVEAEYIYDGNSAGFGAISVEGSGVGSSLGGIAGSSSGTIQGSGFNWNNGAYLSRITVGSSGESGWFGGVVGSNSGTVSDICLQANVQGGAGTNYGYGGVAGRNLSGGIIRGCGLAGSGSAVTLISAVSGNAGGAAGINSGTITAFYKTGSVSVDAFVDTDTVEKHVEIRTGSGTAGGVAGRNTQSASVTDCETGADWRINGSWSEETTEGSTGAAGGMIGRNESSRPLDGLVNRASVSGAYAGGIVGRSSAQTLDVSDCINYGTVSGGSYGGGILGRLERRGGTVDGCENYGRITAASGTGGGILGGLYQMNQSPSLLTIEDCRNYGYLTARNTAGILGASLQGQNTAQVVLNDCINTGFITSGAGIVLDSAGTSYTLNRCRNFGWCEEQYEDNAYCGIVKGENDLPAPDAEINLCFGAAMVRYPIAYSAKTDVANYYFAENTAATTKTSWSSISVWPENPELEIQNVVDGSEDTIWRASSDSKGDATIVMKLENACNINSVEIQWLVDKSNAELEYQIYGTNGYGYFWKLTDELEFESDTKGLITENVSVSGWNRWCAGLIIEISSKNTFQNIAIAEIGINGVSNESLGSSGYPGSTLENRGVGFWVDKDTGKSDGSLLISEISSWNWMIREYGVNELSGSRTFYETANSYLDEILNRLFGDTVTAPTSLTVAQNGSQLELNWTNDASQYIRSTELTLEAYGDANSTSLIGTAQIQAAGTMADGALQSGSFTIPETWYGAYVRVSGKNRGYSTESETVTGETVLLLYTPLETPQYELRLQSDGTYEAQWLNAGGTDAEGNALYAEGDALQIDLGTGNVFQITAPQNKMNPIPADSVPGNLEENTSTAAVKRSGLDTGRVASDTATSVDVNLEPLFADADQNAATITVREPETEGELTVYYAELNGNGYGVTFRAELLSEQQIGTATIPVAVDVTETVLDQEDSDKTTALSAETGSLTNSRIRVFPWCSESGLYNFGYYVAEDLSEAELLSFSYHNTGIIADEGIVPGYSIEMRTDRSGGVSYAVVYSPLLEDGRYASGNDVVLAAGDPETPAGSEEEFIESGEELSAQELNSQPEDESGTEEQDEILEPESEAADEILESERESETESEMLEPESETETESGTLELESETESGTLEPISETESETLEPESEIEIEAIPAPEVTTGTYEAKAWIDTYTASETGTVLSQEEQTLEHRSLEWEAEANADGYLMTVYRLKNQESDSEFPEAFSMLLYQANGTYVIALPPTLEQIEDAAMRQEKGEEVELLPRTRTLAEDKELLKEEQQKHPEIISLYTVQLDTELMGDYYVYEQSYKEMNPDRRSALVLYAELQVLTDRDGRVTVRLVLPDLEPDADSESFCKISYRMTRSVVISTLVQKEQLTETQSAVEMGMESSYHQGLRSQWLRLENKKDQGVSERIRQLQPEEKLWELDQETAENYVIMSTADPEINLTQAALDDMDIPPVADQEMEIELDLSGVGTQSAEVQAGTENQVGTESQAGTENQAGSEVLPDGSGEEIQIMEEPQAEFSSESGVEELLEISP